MKFVPLRVLLSCLFTASAISYFFSQPALSNDDKIRALPPIFGFYLCKNSMEGDHFFGVNDLARARESYARARQATSISNQVTLLTYEAWSLCLSKEFAQAIEQIKTAISSTSTTDFVMQNHCKRLLGRIYAEQCEYQKSQEVFQDMRPEEKAWLHDTQSLLSLLWINDEKEAYQLAKQRYEGSRCAHPSALPLTHEIFGGLFSRSSISLRPLMESSSDEKFSDKKWKAFPPIRSNYRLRVLRNLTEQVLVLGMTKAEVRRLLGAPSFLDEATVYQDFFPVCLERFGIQCEHSGETLGSVREGNVRDAQSSDCVWFLVVSYDEKQGLAKIEVTKKLPIYPPS